MNTKEITIRYKEAVRYMENASDILRTKAKKKDDFYTDSKYVSMACGTAYKAVLLALEAYLEMKGKPLKPKANRPNVDDFRRALSTDKKMLNYFNSTWESLHCAGYYDGYLGVKIIRAGFEYANIIINAIRPTGMGELKAEI